MRSPIVYPGGKGSMTAKILKYIPEHKTYLEPFFGGGSVFFAKKPCGFETINDINCDIVNLFRTLQDVKKSKQLIRILDFTPCSREILNDALNYEKIAINTIDRAALYFINLRQSFSGSGKGWSFSVNNTDNRKMAANVSRWIDCINLLPEVITRLKQVQIENDDFEKVIKRFDDTDCFIYADPPYLHKTRADTKLYTYEMSTADHERFLKVCIETKSKVMISGYNSELYESFLSGWNKKEFHVVNNMTNSRKMKAEKRTEVLWMNYDINKNQPELW